MAKVCGVIMLMLAGCSSAVDSAPVEKPVDVEAFISSVDTQAKALATVLAAQKLTGEMTLENTHAIMKKLNTLEASLAKSEPQNGKDGDPASVLPDPPAKANTQKVPLKVATPGDSSETLTELATRLYGQGVSVHMKTEDELKAIDAQLNGGQAVSGAMFQNNGTSAITSKRSAVRFVPRGSSFVQWQNNTTQSACGPNGCPPRRSR